jgi:hypothetical protein
MPSIAQIKHLASLRMSKFRQKYGQFVVEGRKQVEEVSTVVGKLRGFGQRLFLRSDFRLNMILN